MSVAWAIGWAAWSSAAHAAHESWDNPPAGIRRYLIDRMRERAIGIAELNQLRLRIESNPEVPEAGSFTICGQGAFPKTFLLRNQVAKGTAV